MGGSPGRAPDRPLGAMVLGAIVSVQCGGAVATELFDRLGPGGKVFLRSTLGAAVFLTIARPSPRLFRQPGFRQVIVFSLVLFGMNCCFYAAIDRIPLGSAVTQEFIGPLGIAILGSRRKLDWSGSSSRRPGLIVGSQGLDLTEVAAVSQVVVASAGALRSANTPPPLDN